ncbi:MAG TPA: nitroreductase family protein [Lactovum miscens]|uniref:nitroreductase family protein n=1 Tax=Lactovum miscens TaxID=190387 RepID=UPI002EDAA702
MANIIEIMKAHSSVRKFTDEVIPDKKIREFIEAGRSAGNWKNFQSYSVIIVKSIETKNAIYEAHNSISTKAVMSCSHFIVFVGDMNRAEKAVKLNGGDFQPAGVESILISSIDAALAAENVLLAAEADGFGGVMMGLLREKSVEISDILGLPDYTYPLFGIALGVPAKINPVKPRLPYETMVFNEKYVEQDESVIRAYDEVQSDYAGTRRLGSSWSSRIVEQWGKPEERSSTENLKAKKLL